MSRRLLLVEDHDGLRRIIGNFLSEKFDVVGAKNGLEAMSWLSKGVMPDVIVTDSTMPEIDGAALLSNLPLQRIVGQYPVVVLGGGSSDDAAEEQHFRTLGAYAYFAKPFSPSRLQDRLMDIVG